MAGLDDAPGGGGMMGGAGGGSDKDDDFSTAFKGAESFLNALKKKDPEKLAATIAKHAEYEAKESHREMFKNIALQSASGSEIDELARAVSGMKVMDSNVRKSSGTWGIIVGKQDSHERTTRTLLMRHEKDGWKVQDVGPEKVLKIGPPPAKKK